MNTNVTRILHDLDHGVSGASDRLLAVVYDELRRIAASKMAHESPGQTLQPTALVHEAYLRLVTPRQRASASEATPDLSSSDTCTGQLPAWESRGHFFAAAGEAMRRILIDSARRKKRLKRGGDHRRVAADNVDIVAMDPTVDLLELDEALQRLEDRDKLKADIVKLRFFAGLTLEETSTALDISVPTVHRHWRYARAWLRRELSTSDLHCS